MSARVVRWVMAGLLVSVAPACKPAPSPDRVEAQRQFALVQAARARGDALSAAAAAETAFVFDTSSNPRDVLLARLDVFARSPLAQTELARTTAAHQAELLLRDERDPRARAICLTAAARVHLERGEPGPAVMELDAALRELPTFIPALLTLATHQEGQKRWAEAAKLYERALAVSERLPQALERYGAVLVMMGELDRAIAFLDGARQLDLAPAIRVQLADALVARGRPADAAAFLRQVLTRLSAAPPATISSSQLATLRRRLAWSEADLGHLEDAEALARQAQFDSPSIEGLLLLAQVDLMRGATDRAIDIVTRHAAEIPPTPRCLFVATLAMARAGRADEARRFGAQYVELAKVDPAEGGRLPRVLETLRGLASPPAPARDREPRRTTAR